MMPFFRLVTLSLCMISISEEDLDEDLLSHTIMKDICISLTKNDFIESETANHEMRWQDDLLYLREQIYIPDDESLRLWILHAFHDSQTADHLDRDKTLISIRQWFYWLKMTLFMTQYVKSCDLCDWIKSVRHLSYDELQLLSALKQLWTHITVNFITDLLKFINVIDGWLYNMILIVVNRFSKMSHYILIIKDLDSVQFMWLFLWEVIWLHHVPEMIISDHSTLFCSEFWVTLLRLLRTDHRLFTAFHPQTDRQMKHQNQTLKHYLQCYMNYLQND